VSRQPRGASSVFLQRSTGGKHRGAGSSHGASMGLGRPRSGGRNRSNSRVRPVEPVGAPGSGRVAPRWRRWRCATGAYVGEHGRACVRLRGETTPATRCRSSSTMARRPPVPSPMRATRSPSSSSGAVLTTRRGTTAMSPSRVHHRPRRCECGQWPPGPRDGRRARRAGRRKPRLRSPHHRTNGAGQAAPVPGRRLSAPLCGRRQ
jgi:hypothetical protein